MKKIFIYTTIVAALAIACDKTDNEPIHKGIEPNSDVVMITEKVSANVNPSSKANVDADAKFTWIAGDQLAVHVNDGNYYTANLTSGAGSNNGTFTVSYPDGQSRDAFAIYPASIVATDAANYGQSGSSLDVTLPSTYTLTQVSGTTTPCPMIAVNEAGNGWAFKQLCGFLRLTVNDIPSGTKRLEIYFDGKKVSGDFSIASPVAPESSVIETSADAINDYVEVSNGGDDFSSSVVLNIPLPVGTYTNVSVVSYNATSGGVATLAGKTSFSYTASRKKGTKKTISIDTKIFSVGARKHVVIANSNLQATTTDLGASWNWHFATNPWDYIGVGYSNRKINGNGTVYENGTVDLFGWVGASNNTWEGALGTPGNAAMHGISNSKDNRSTSAYGNVSGESLKSDWGNTINDGYTWRTLSMAEWSYMFNSRSSGSTVNGALIYTSGGSKTGTVTNARYVLATINSVHGLIIFPNGVTFEGSEATWRYINDRIPSSLGSTTWNDGTQCTTEQWTALAAKGCVFLPATGHRNGTDVYYYNGEDNCGHYWTSTPNGDNQALFMRFVKTEGAATSSFNHERWYGHAVRLVRNMN